MRRTSIHFALALTTLTSLALFSACEPEPETPTPTPTVVILAASPTININIGVNPLTPVGDEALLDAQAQEGTRIAGYTPAAPPLAADNSTITPTPAPTEAVINMQFSTDDGLTIYGAYYPSNARPAPIVLLLHDLKGRKEDWQITAERLQRSGISSVAVDVRGFGLTGGESNWAKAIRDVEGMLGKLRALPNIDPTRVSVLGAGIGANLALVACARLPESACKSAILISPAPANAGIEALSALDTYKARPLLVAASRADGTAAIEGAALDKAAKGDHRLIIYDGNARGPALLETQPNLIEIIVRALGGKAQFGG